jgi:uncharacterized protein (TIGR03663 family)
LTSETRPPVDSGRWIHGKWITAAEIDQHESDSALALAPRGLHIPFRWEVALYVTLIIAALLLRVWGLGDRAVHHDESLHGFFAWDLYQGRQYFHNPLTHGMFLFHIISASFFLFGDNEFTMRLPMALFGTVLVATPLLLRPRMGQIAALVAALLITVSPSLLYFSRFARNDLFIAVFTIMLIGALFRYVDEKKDRWLYVAAAALALGFTAKENWYILVGTIGLYLVWRTAPELWDWLMGRESIKEFSPAAGFLVLMVGLCLPLAAAGTSVFDEALGLTLSAPAPPNLPLGYATGEPLGNGSYIVAIVIVSLFMAGGWALGLLWKPKVWLVSWAIFALIFTLMFTNLVAHPEGVGTGVWQSLTYWLEQQGVKRGDQPWYYYFMISSAYEFLPFVFTVGTAFFVAWRTGLMAAVFLAAGAVALSIAAVISIGDKVPHNDFQVLAPTLIGVLLLLAFTMTARTTQFKRFLLFWSILNFTAYSLAGEKMPWLLTHITLPFIFVTATTIGDIVMHIKWKIALGRGNWLLLIGVPMFFLLVWKLIYFNMDTSPGKLSKLFPFLNIVGSFLSLFLILTTIGLILVFTHYLGTRITQKSAWGSAILVIALILFAYTFRASWQASYIYSDVPQEMLIYTQTSPDLVRVAKDIELAGELTGKGKDVAVTIDTSDSYAWPWHWYLRGYTNVDFRDMSQDGATAKIGVDVAVINARNDAKFRPDYFNSYTTPRKIEHRAWFPEDYRGLTAETFWDTIWSRERWRGAVDFFVYRKIRGNIGSVDSYVYFNKSLPLTPLR